jgi:hypothetical protein
MEDFATELFNLKEQWFAWYDMQVTKYNREMRMYGKSNIDINALDAQAEQNKQRIKSLEQQA